MSSKDCCVALVPLDAYPQSLVDAATNRILTAVAGDRAFSGAKVLVKPNLICARNGALACSEPAVMQGVARWFIDRGAHVKLGDSPAFGSAKAVLRACGALEELVRLGVEIVEFDRVERVVVADTLEVQVAAASRECDLLVNVPRVKAHAQARVTMAVKNMFGCVAGPRKAWWHMAYGGKYGSFAERLVLLLAAFPNSISVLDGVRAMHETGPIHGKPFSAGVLGASTSPVALDTAFLHLFGVVPESCPLWAAAKKLGVPGVMLEDISWLLLSPGDFCVEGFRVPDSLMPIRFNPFRYLKNSIRRAAAPYLAR